jgi:hypothetical protein
MELKLDYRILLIQDSQKIAEKIARVDQKSSIILQIINNLTPML